MPNVRDELIDGLRLAAAGAFRPRYYRVKVSPRRGRRYRRPGMASPLTLQEARAMQAFVLLEDWSLSEVGRRFHRTPMTVRKALRDPRFLSPEAAATISTLSPCRGIFVTRSSDSD